MGKASYTLLGHDGYQNGDHSQGIQIVRALKIAFVALSIALNVLLLHREWTKPTIEAPLAQSKYASLLTNTTNTYDIHTGHGSPLLDKQNAAWNDTDLKAWDGVVALDQDFVETKGLLPSQPWRWDQTKSMYFLAGPHQMLCLHTIREYINELRAGLSVKDQFRTYPHVTHCLNTLREAIMCNADDTPLYMGKYNENAQSKHPIIGAGSPFQCRDWHALMEWSRSRSACYIGPYDRGMENKTEEERYMFCPEGMTKPWESTAHSEKTDMSDIESQE